MAAPGVWFCQGDAPDARASKLALQGRRTGRNGRGAQRLESGSHQRRAASTAGERTAVPWQGGRALAKRWCPLRGARTRACPSPAARSCTAAAAVHQQRRPQPQRAHMWVVTGDPAPAAGDAPAARTHGRGRRPPCAAQVGPPAGRRSAVQGAELLDWQVAEVAGDAGEHQPPAGEGKEGGWGASLLAASGRRGGGHQRADAARAARAPTRASRCSMLCWKRPGRRAGLQASGRCPADACCGGPAAARPLPMQGQPHCLSVQRRYFAGLQVVARQQQPSQNGPAQREPSRRLATWHTAMTGAARSQPAGPADRAGRPAPRAVNFAALLLMRSVVGKRSCRVPGLTCWTPPQRAGPAAWGGPGDWGQTFHSGRASCPSPTVNTCGRTYACANATQH
jgi:hypothetical protein